MDSLPRNLDAERALLSAMMLDPREYERLRGRLTLELFSSERHRVVLGAIERVVRAGLDPNVVSILTEIDRDDHLSKEFRGPRDEGIGLLAELTAAGIPSRSAQTYLALVEEAAHKRQVLRAGEELQALARNGASAADLARAFHAYALRMERILSSGDGIRFVDVGEAITAELPPVPWIADGWFGEGDLVIFGGEWATGKSVIALDLAISVAAGLRWMGRVPITKAGPVVYVDEENNARNVARRLSRMIRGRNFDPADASGIPLRYLTKNALRLDGPRGLATLRTEIETRRPVLVILDSLIRLHGADENDNSKMAAFFAEAVTPLATKYGCAFVVLDHLRKPSKDDERFDPGHRLRGAGDKAGVGDGLWTLEGDRETDMRTLSCRKNRWEDSLPPALTTRWRVSEDETAAWIECQDASLNAELAVRTALAASPAGLFASDLYDRLTASGANKRTAIRLVKRLAQSGQIESRKERGNRVRYWVGTLVQGEA
jgi:hypothetical protein